MVSGFATHSAAAGTRGLYSSSRYLTTSWYPHSTRVANAFPLMSAVANS